MAASAALKLTDKEGLALARLRVLGKLEERNVQVAETLQKLVDRIASKADQPFRPARLGAVKALTQFSFDPDGPKTREKKESREEALDRLKTDIYRMQNPQVLIDVLEKRTEILSYVAPETTAHTARVFGDAMAFLQSKIPTNVYEGKIVGGVASRWKPSKFELDKFERYVNAVNRPLTVIEQMAEGVLNREGVEVLKFVYPAMFYELQQSVLDTVGRMEEPLPYRTRMLLSNVLSVPLDPSFKPKTAGMLQASFTPPPPPEQRAPAAKSKIKLDDNLATETQNTALNGQFA